MEYNGINVFVCFLQTNKELIFLFFTFDKKKKNNSPSLPLGLVEQHDHTHFGHGVALPPVSKDVHILTFLHQNKFHSPRPIPGNTKEFQQFFYVSK